MRERVYRAEGVIIRRSEYGEADRMLTILTPQGKRRVIAKGIRKTTSRLAGHVELFTHATLMLAVGRGLDVLTQSVALEQYDLLRGDLVRIGAAYYIAELFDRFTEEEDENRRAFSILVASLQLLNSGANIDLVLRACELHLLDALGYRPQLRACAICGETLTEETGHFSPAAGGAICRRCSIGDIGALTMSLATFKLLRYLQTHEIGAVQQMSISAETRRESERLLQAYIRRILERDLKSVAFLEEVRTQHVQGATDGVSG